MNIEQEVREYLRYLEQEAKSPKTIRQYKMVLQNFASSSKEVSKLTVKEFYEGFIAGKAPATRRMYYAALNSFFEWSIQEELLESNPLLKNKIPKTKALPTTVSYIPEADLNAVKRRIAGLESPLRVAYTIMREGGLRASEVCDLNVDSVHIASWGIELVVFGKGSKTRVLPFFKHTDTCKLLKKYLKGANPMSPLFRNESNKRVTYSDLEYAWGTKISTKYTMHQLRHSKGTDMIKHGVPLEIVQEWFGHSDIATARRYSAVTKSVSNKEIERYQAVN